MTHQTAYTILTKYIHNPVLLQHSLIVEAVMRSFAPRFNGDIEEWGITGLLHDADYEKSKGHPEQHGTLLTKLEPNSIPSTVERAIASHNYLYTHILPESFMEWALLCCDELTGIILALVEKQPASPASQGGKDKKLSSLPLQTILDALQKNMFPKKVTENIFLCEEKLGIPLNEFVALTLSAMQAIAPQLGY